MFTVTPAPSRSVVRRLLSGIVSLALIAGSAVPVLVIGTLNNAGGGKYQGQFGWPVNPQNITVKSSGGGSASSTVAAK